ncbi:MAG: hypothetical protein F7C35_04515 [Desulfurococcales archaeon]|nr:hypothetical protein [Desulfurococcales archaeon]
MVRVEDLLLGGERVRVSVSFSGIRIAVTDYGVIVRSEGLVMAINPAHIASVGYQYALGYFVAGVLLLLLSYLGLYWSGPLSSYIMGFLFIVGIALAIYGWLYRYKLVLFYTGGKIDARGGGNVPKAARELRKLLTQQKLGTS